MTNIESVVSEKKEFVSGAMVKFNYSFVPAACNKLYMQYVDKQSAFSPKQMKFAEKAGSAEAMKDIASDKDKTYRFQKQAEELKELASEINGIGYNIMKIIIDKNPQEFDKECDLIEFVNENMSTLDQTQFIITACVGDALAEKKS